MWPMGHSLLRPGLNYTFWCTGVVKYKYQPMVLLIFAPQVYTNDDHWLAPKELLAYLGYELYTECNLGSSKTRECA